MDTRLKNYKYSTLNKFICMLIACIMASGVVLNVLPVMRYYAVFEGAVFNKASNTFYDSRVFEHYIQGDINSIINEARANVRRAEYEKKKTETAETNLEKYHRQQAGAEKLTYDDVVEEYGEGYEDYGVYQGKDGFYYTDYYYYYFSGGDAGASDNIEYGLSDEEFKNIVYEAMGNNYDDGIHYSSNLENLKYYAKCDDGTVATNVENPDEFISNIKNGVYLIAGHGQFQSSKEFSDYEGYSWSEYDDCVTYIAFDENFPAPDTYSEAYAEYQLVKDINFTKCFINLVICAIAMFAFLIMSIRLAGNQADSTFKNSRIDSIPQDLHFIFFAGAGFGIGFGIAWIVTAFMNNVGGSTIIKYEKYVTMLLAFLGALFYLVIFEFATSLARSVKSEKSTFKNLLIVRICLLVWKAVKWLFSGAGMLISKTKNGVKKCARGAKKLIYIPKHLDKKSIALLSIFVFANFSVAWLIGRITRNGYNYPQLFIFFLILAAFDIFCIYKAVKYMRSLDMIVDLVDKNEPIGFDAEQMPESLGILVDGYKQTQQKLDEAVAKAIKDEHLKTELITNVSHDLKTPLTSIINYVDLLGKCDINDETAKQYMQVIDEKSNKLKRLIEDLIEASKVTTGNVTLNKTKINLNELANQAIVEESADIEKAGLQIVFDDTDAQNYAYADGAKVYRVFENLLSNARKYSAPGSRVYARVFEDKSHSYFEIKNISKEQLNITPDELTERFIRGDKSRNLEGNGLGLSIAKELCALNGGELVILIDGDLFKATVKLPKM